MAADDMTLPDGSRMQSGLAKMDIIGRLPEYSLFGVILECVVVAVRFYSDPANTTGFVEYDCDPLTPSVGRIKNAVRLEAMSGLDDGDENVLRVAQATADGSAWSKDGKQARSDSDGDRVLVQFINGSKDRPVIVGCMPRPGNRVQSNSPEDSAHQRTRTLKHRGTTVQIDGQGNLSVDISGNTDKKDPAPTTKTLTLTKGGATQIIKVTNTTIEYGVGADQHVVLGEELMTRLDDLSTRLSDHIAGYVAHTHIGNLGAPTSPPSDAVAQGIIKTAVDALKTAFSLVVPANAMLSEWIKSKKQAP